MPAFLCNDHDHWQTSPSKPKECLHCIDGVPCGSELRGEREKKPKPPTATLQSGGGKGTVVLPPD